MMSDAVAVALITTVGSVLVAILTQLVAIWNGNKAADSDDQGHLKKDNVELKKQNDELQEIVDYYRKRDDK
ncbi:hypothetical protein [Lactiplantibacillus herbarum]|uniref:hypothetical protein n=1 Tax=Lactiplantibacillus herbarum TaxID=1670446 RepID=UPI00064FDBB2|nr:hypothetical protein [Lactiplantibacillus herbarum]